ncbi:MAG: hypothetical protein FWE03_02485 [Firmicutes bacterium]|nr:hypothetical protein [Bacillota bacterium]
MFSEINFCASRDAPLNKNLIRGPNSLAINFDAPVFSKIAKKPSHSPYTATSSNDSLSAALLPASMDSNTAEGSMKISVETLAINMSVQIFDIGFFREV